MTLDINGRTIELTETGFLSNPEDWSAEIAEAMARADGVELSDPHWDVINYLREEYLNNGGNQPNNRALLKAMGEKWARKVASKDLYDLFPGNPSKQAGAFGGLPESRRKGGY